VVTHGYLQTVLTSTFIIVTMVTDVSTLLCYCRHSAILLLLKIKGAGTFVSNLIKICSTILHLRYVLTVYAHGMENAQ
jgi:hypothetical protein